MNTRTQILRTAATITTSAIGGILLFLTLAGPQMRMADETPVPSPPASLRLEESAQGWISPGDWPHDYSPHLAARDGRSRAACRAPVPEGVRTEHQRARRR